MRRDDPFNKPKKKKGRDYWGRIKRSQKIGKIWGGGGDTKKDEWGKPEKKQPAGEGLFHTPKSQRKGILSRLFNRDRLTLRQYYNRLDQVADYNVQAEVSERLEILQQQSDAKLSGGLVALIETVTGKRLTGGQVEAVKRFANDSRNQTATENRATILETLTAAASARGTQIAATLERLKGVAGKIISLVSKTGA